MDIVWLLLVTILNRGWFLPIGVVVLMSDMVCVCFPCFRTPLWIETITCCVVQQDTLKNNEIYEVKSSWLGCILVHYPDSAIVLMQNWHPLNSCLLLTPEIIILPQIMECTLSTSYGAGLMRLIHRERIKVLWNKTSLTFLLATSQNCMHVCLLTHTHAHTHTRIQTHIHTYKHTRIKTYPHTQTHTHIHTRIQT